MKKKLIIILISLIVAIFWVINATPVNLLFPSTYPRKYCADKCGFWTIEKGLGRDPYRSVTLGFESYKIEKNKPNLVLYRRFKINWWQFWNWIEFIEHPRWKLPYAATDEET